MPPVLIDANRGVWKAPARIGASVPGASGIQFILTDLENGSQSGQALNRLRDFKVYGDVVWGARTSQGNAQTGSQWKYVPIRRVVLEPGLEGGTQWVVFEPNNETLWGQIRINVADFFQALSQQGAFQSTTPLQVHFVKCGVENIPPSKNDKLVVHLLLGFTPPVPPDTPQPNPPPHRHRRVRLIGFELTGC